jgi:hypothetical protein
VPGPADDLLVADPEADRASEDLEALLLVRVDVRGGDEAVGLHERLDHDRLPVRLARRLVEDDPLAGHRVLDHISLRPA